RFCKACTQLRRISQQFEAMFGSKSETREHPPLHRP
uniref:Transcriptional regulator n=1 Tax=Globodera pallida TaxID=36090 RepID=A0A183CSX2_GLOPA